MGSHQEGAGDNAEDREVLSAKISGGAAQGWRNFCGQHGVSVTAMLEVAGQELAEESIPPTAEAWRNMVEKARAVDQARRSRKR